MKKLLVLIAVGAALVASPALAAQPNNQACLGEDISGYARNGETDPTSFVAFTSGSGFGHFVTFVASKDFGPPGAGHEFQNHLAGLVPDSLIANTCNG